MCHLLPLQEHRKLLGMSTANAKLRYIELCRHMKHYGVSFFAVKVRMSASPWHNIPCTSLPPPPPLSLTHTHTHTLSPTPSLPAQEKKPGRNKLRPVLLGVSRDCVMRVHWKTKDILQTWPLTTIQSYATTPKSFSMVHNT